MYTEYWSRIDRWGSSSFTDAEEVVQRILASCGGGKILDIGCGMGQLVRTLLRKGVDARGIDVARNTIEYSNSLVPGRYENGSILQIPYPDNSFQTVVSTDVLEHLTESDIPKAVAELHRVTQRYVFVILSTAPDRDHIWHLTLHGRDWWESQFFLAGFRKHPLIHTILPYESLEQEPDQITLLFEKLPNGINEQYSLELLNSQRYLHMDMLRDSGRRSDAHLARYNLACSFVRSGDIVLDVACGLGYGSAVLAAGSAAARVIGVDNSPYAIQYARDNYATDSSAIEFHHGDAADLFFIEAESVDYVVSFETLEHVPDTGAFLAEIKRVLKPGGRIFVSVPNDWTDETGKDPNPHHLHVYTWQSLKEEITRYFRPEKAYSQIAGGAQKLTDGTRSLKEITIAPSQEMPAEWWLMLAMKDPVAADRKKYCETSFPDYSALPDYNITAFGRDYDNPWLVKGMVSIGMRMTANAELLDMAKEVLSTGRPGSADVGAAICVLAYQVLQQAEAKPEEIHRILEYVKSYHVQADDNPNAWRWRVSNQYVAAQLILKTGDRKRAREAFQACGGMDSLRYSPLLATKTVDAWYYAGVIAAGDDCLDEARNCWLSALKEAERAAHCDWLNVWGSADEPASFGLPEMTHVLDKASRAGYALMALKTWAHRPGWSWNQSLLCMSRDLDAWHRVAEARLEWVEYLNRHLGIISGQLAERNQQLAERDLQLAECNRQLAERGRQVEAGEQYIQSLLDSYSWKITRPLRYILSVVLGRTGAR